MLTENLGGFKNLVLLIQITAWMNQGPFWTDEDLKFECCYNPRLLTNSTKKKKKMAA